MLAITTIISFLLFILFGSAAAANTTATTVAPAASSSAAAADDVADFGQTLPIAGNMDRTDTDFVDGFAVDLLSPKNRTFVVTQNTKALDGKFVSGTTGENFQAILPYSYVIKLSEPATDLIAKVELPYDPAKLKAAGFDPADTYVGKLGPDGKSWMIMENQRNVHKSENKTRIIKMTSLDGEYLLMGRRDIDSSNIFVQYGQGETRTANFTGGPGRQEAEFIDGLRFSVETDQPVRMNVEIQSPVNMAMIPTGMKALNSFSYVINTTAASPKGQPAVVSPANLAPAPDTSESTSAMPAATSIASLTRVTSTSIGSATLFRTSTAQSIESQRAFPPRRRMATATTSLRNGTIDFPVNLDLLRSAAAAMMGSNNTKAKAVDLEDVRFMIGRRAVGASNAQFQLMSANGGTNGTTVGQNTKLKLLDGKVRLNDVKQLDGEYVVLVMMENQRQTTLKQGQGVNTTSASTAPPRNQINVGVLTYVFMILLGYMISI